MVTSPSLESVGVIDEVRFFSDDGYMNIKTIWTALSIEPNKFGAAMNQSSKASP